ncbi:DEAD/DEAH box helicase [Candidatus Woesearchaeota archaeon]|nr:DEAD/DEAH box helicase [Candidatus Woesearchaeota archaeon]
MDELFPYKTVRGVQSELIKEIDDAVKTKSHLITHAPTGLGKTAAALSPVLKHAIDNNLTIFFLTSRHTQHLIAVETLQEIRK